MTDTPKSTASLELVNPVSGELLTSTLDAQPAKPGWKTTEFWLGLAAKILGGLYAAGFIGDGTLAARVAGLAVVVLAYFGYAVSRGLAKSAGALLLVFLVGSSTVPAATGCAKSEQIAGEIKGVVIDCIHADQGPIEQLLIELGLDALTQALHAAAVDWSALEAKAEAQGMVVGGCAYAMFVHGATAGTASTSSELMTIAPAISPAAASLERLRAKAGGARWSTSVGQL